MPGDDDDDDDDDDDRDDDLDFLASAVLSFNTSSFTDPPLTASPVGLHTEGFLLLTLLINYHLCKIAFKQTFFIAVSSVNLFSTPI
jgi:hypothetical protein